MIYFYVEFANPGADYQQYDIMLSDQTKHIMCNVARDSAEAYCVDLTTDVVHLGHAPNSFFAHGDGFEGIIDIRDLIEVDDLYITHINVMVGGEFGVGEWRTAETWFSTSPLPSQEESLLEPPDPEEDLPPAEPVDEGPAPESSEVVDETPTDESTSLTPVVIGGGILLLGAAGWFVLSRRKRTAG